MELIRVYFLLAAAPFLVVSQNSEPCTQWRIRRFPTCSYGQECRLVAQCYGNGPCHAKPQCVPKARYSSVCRIAGAPVLEVSNRPFMCYPGKDCPSRTTCNNQNNCCWSGKATVPQWQTPQRPYDPCASMNCGPGTTCKVKQCLFGTCLPTASCVRHSVPPPYGRSSYSSFAPAPTGRPYGPNLGPHFGGPPAHSFGPSPTLQPFGRPPRIQPFGQPPPIQPFGQPPTIQPFGQSQAVQPLGQPSTNTGLAQSLPPECNGVMCPSGYICEAVRIPCDGSLAACPRKGQCVVDPGPIVVTTAMPTTTNIAPLGAAPAMPAFGSMMTIGGRPGVCPTNVTGVCDMNCEADGDCDISQKCCRHKCGALCVAPVKGSNVTTTLPAGVNPGIGVGIGTSPAGAITGPGGMAASPGGFGAQAGGMGANVGGMGAQAGGMGAQAGGMGAQAGGMGTQVGGMGTQVGGMGANVGGMGAQAGGMPMGMTSGAAGMTSGAGGMPGGSRGFSNGMGGISNTVGGLSNPVGGANNGLSGTSYRDQSGYPCATFPCPSHQECRLRQSCPTCRPEPICVALMPRSRIKKCPNGDPVLDFYYQEMSCSGRGPVHRCPTNTQCHAIPSGVCCYSPTINVKTGIVSSPIRRSCSEKTCGPNHVCREEASNCFRAPCPPVKAVCRPVISNFNSRVLSKQGMCPTSVITGLNCITMRRCAGDVECPGQQKCCNSNCGMVCQESAMARRAVPADKAGTCPTNNGVVGSCVEACSADSSCQGIQKCCRNGCGHTCQNPTVNTTSINRPGSCPNSATLGQSCQQQCSSDGNCPFQQKCCATMCGFICATPLLSSPTMSPMGPVNVGVTYGQNDPCKNEPCGMYKVCHLQQVRCIRAPCSIVTTCVAQSPSTSSSVCQSGYPLLDDRNTPMTCTGSYNCPDHFDCVSGSCCWRANPVSNQFGVQQYPGQNQPYQNSNPNNNDNQKYNSNPQFSGQNPPYNSQPFSPSKNQGYSPQNQGLPLNQGGPFNQGAPFNQGGPFNQGSPLNQGVPLSQGLPLNQGSSLSQGLPLNQGSSLSQGVPLNPGSSLTQGSPLNPGSPLNQGFSLNQGSPFNQGYSPPNQGPSPTQGYSPQNQGYSQQNQGPAPLNQPYTPQNQQGYSPPNQQGYSPPNQQGYSPPNQQGSAPQNQQYTPPNQQGFSPQNQGYNQQNSNQQGQQQSGNNCPLLDVNTENHHCQKSRSCENHSMCFNGQLCCSTRVCGGRCMNIVG